MKKTLNILVIITLLAGTICFNMPKAQAAPITSVTDVLSRVKLGVLSNHTITFTTPTGVAAGETIIITFPTDFTGEASIDYTDVDMYATTERTLAAAADGATWGALFSSVGGTRNRLTLTSGTGTVVAGGVVVIEIGTNATTGVTGDKQITNATTAGSYTVPISSGSADSGSYAIAIATEDQVGITAAVDPYLVFNVTDATVALGTLSLTVVKTDTATMTAATNSTAGYTITVNGGTLVIGAGPTPSIDAIGAAHAASAVGTEQFGLRIAAAAGAGVPVDPYDDVAQYAFDSAAVPDEVAHSLGVSATTTFTMTYMANIATTTEPGAYTATHTYICTGNF